jgi:hypothetical protein
MDEREAIRRWVDAWREAGPRLEELRRNETAEADNLQVLAQLESAFNYAITLPPRESSGIVEMQRWFRKLRK